MITTTISIRDNATPTVQGLMDRMQPDALNQIAGRSAANVFKRWFREMNAGRPNKLGGKRTNFWGKAAAAVGFDTESDGATVFTAATGVLFQRHGGTLKPSGRPSSVTGRPIVNLAIPARAEAHGRLPSEFNNLIPMFRRINGSVRAVALVEAEATEIKIGKQRKDGTRMITKIRKVGGLVMFWLSKMVRKDADESVFPPDDLVRDAVQLDLLDYVLRNARRMA